MSSSAPTSSEAFSALEHAIRSKDFDEVETAWLELLTEHPEEVEALVEYAERIASVIAPGEASLLLQMMAPDLMSKGSYEDALKVLRKAAEYTPMEDDVRGQVIECLKELYRDNELLEKALDVSGIGGGGSIVEALDAFETCIEPDEGGYVYHEAGWGVGKIVRVDVERDEVYVDFEKKKNHRMAYSAMGTLVKRLAPDHYRVLLAFNVEALKRIAEDDPPGLVKKLLREEGRSLTLRQLKGFLVDVVISTSGWSKWWSKAKAELRRDPSVDLGGGSNPVMELRSELMSYEASMLEKYNSDHDAGRRAALVREYLKHLDECNAAEFLSSVVSDTARRAASPATEPHERLLGIMLLREIRDAYGPMQEVAIPDAIAFLREQGDVAGLVEEVPIDEYQKAVMPLLQEAYPDTWPDIYGELLLRNCPATWDLAYRGLYCTGDYARIRRVFREAARMKEQKVDNFTWFCRSGIHGRISPEILGCSRVELLEDLLLLLDKMGSNRGAAAVGDEARSYAGKIRHIIFQEIGDRMAMLFEEAGIDRTRQLIHLIANNHGLDEHQVRVLEGKAYSVFPKLGVTEKAAHEDDLIYVTEAGLMRRQADLRRLSEEELPRVAREIGRSKEFGDLSENAEYSAALEKQAQLARRAEQIQSELKRAKIITPDMVDESLVSIGTRVTLLNVDESILEAYTILGPWDAAPERKILSYKAALAQGIMGLRVGEQTTIDLPEGPVTYEIKAIVNALT